MGRKYQDKNVREKHCEEGSKEVSHDKMKEDGGNWMANNGRKEFFW